MPVSKKCLRCPELFTGANRSQHCPACTPIVAQLKRSARRSKKATKRVGPCPHIPCQKTAPEQRPDLQVCMFQMSTLEKRSTFVNTTGQGFPQGDQPYVSFEHFLACLVRRTTAT